MLPLTRPRRPWTCTVRTGLRGSEDPVAHYHAMHSCRSPSAAWWTSDHTSPTTAIAKPLTKKGPNPSVFPRPLPSASFPHASSSTLQKAPGRLVAQTLLLPDPDPSPWGGGRGGSQETLPPGEACDAKPLLRQHIFQLGRTAFQDASKHPAAPQPTPRYPAITPYVSSIVLNILKVTDITEHWELNTVQLHHLQVNKANQAALKHPAFACTAESTRVTNHLQGTDSISTQAIGFP
ncbi:hypothetical protein Anapl_08816 [Anas platyrhynchos]|uniref:Uncharacterized protein n=1 Tax=Anas platyrhynchos TaxID=8839 RepID=R0LDT8_ANAPL|nr:hypothetical protein Anapl_08816 [Anas platyrhynchos]